MLILFVALLIIHVAFLIAAAYLWLTDRVYSALPIMLMAVLLIYSSALTVLGAWLEPEGLLKTLSLWLKKELMGCGDAATRFKKLTEEAGVVPGVFVW